jgi:hypothetical protein
MKLLAPILAVLALFVLPGQSKAQETAPRATQAPVAPSIPTGEDVITILQLNERAPHAGMLLNTDTSIRWTNRLNWYRNELQLNINTNLRITEALEHSHAVELRLVEESYRREILGLRADLREQARRLTREEPWYSTFSFGLIIGTVVSAAVVGFTAWAVSST